MSKQVAVIGCGAWGTTLSILLTQATHSVRLWSYEKELVPEMQELRENKKYLPGFQLPQQIEVTHDLGAALLSAELVIFAVPSQYIGSVVKECRGKLPKGALLLSASKGIDEKTLKRPSEVIEEALKIKPAVLSGPNLAHEIAQGMPAASVVASINPEVALQIQEILMLERFRVYTSRDPIGVEFGGALKNIVAIAAGAVDGLGFGDNTKSALIIRGIKEMSHLGVSLGAKAETFSGLSGMGDLITTCSSGLSRNHRVGFELAKGKKLEEILSSKQSVAEGVRTSKAAKKLSEKYKVEMPITTEVYEVLFKGKDVYQAMLALMSRAPTSE